MKTGKAQYELETICWYRTEEYPVQEGMRILIQYHHREFKMNFPTVGWVYEGLVLNNLNLFNGVLDTSPDNIICDISDIVRWAYFPRGI